MKQLSYNDMIVKGFKIFSKDWKLFTSIAILSAIPVILYSFFQTSLGWSVILTATIIITSILAMMIYTLAVPLVLKGKRNLKKGSWHHIKTSFIPLIGTYILTILIALLAIIVGSIPAFLVFAILSTIFGATNGIIILSGIIGFIFITIAVIIVGTYLFFAPYIVILEEKKCLYAIKESYKRIKVQFEKTLWAIIIIKLIAFVLSLIPLLIFAPFVMLGDTGFIISQQISLVAQFIIVIPTTLMGVIYFLYRGYKIKGEKTEKNLVKSNKKVIEKNTQKNSKKKSTTTTSKKINKKSSNKTKKSSLKKSPTKKKNTTRKNKQ